MGSVIKNATYDRGFTKISNELINSPSLSGKAKAILIYILSKPSDWETRTDDIVAHMKDGLDAIKAGLKELSDAGYLVRRRIQDKHGQFKGWETLAYESPLPKVDFPTVGDAESGLTDSGKTHNRKNRFRENPPLLSTDLLPSTEFKQKTESMSFFGKNDSIATLPVLDSEPDVHRNLPKTQEANQTPPGKAEVTRQGDSSGAAKNSQKSKKTPKADSIYASLRSRETFEKFWKWYRDEVCSIAQAKTGDKAEAAKAWQQLESSDFFGCGLEGFRLGCHLAKKAAIAAKGVGTKHACRFLGGGDLGEPEWFTLHQEREDSGSSDFLAGVDVANDIAAVRTAIAVELKRLDIPGILPEAWQQRTGVASVGRLDLPQSLEYLKYLRGVSHAIAAA